MLLCPKRGSPASRNNASGDNRACINIQASDDREPNCLQRAGGTHLSEDATKRLFLTFQSLFTSPGSQQKTSSESHTDFHVRNCFYKTVNLIVRPLQYVQYTKELGFMEEYPIGDSS